MAVTSKPTPVGRPDWLSMLLGKLGLILLVLSAGLLFFAVNGGFSVIGLGVVARSFNDAGKLAWAVLTSVEFALPPTIVQRVPGLSATQPLLPWIFVAASSLLQIACLILALNGRKVPLILAIPALLLTVYDIGSTFFGLGTIVWIKQAGYLLQGVLTLLLALGLETSIGFIFKRK